MKKSSRVHITVLKIIFCHIYFSFLKVEIKWVNSRPLLYPNTGFPCGSAGKESAYHAGDLGSIPGLGRSPGEGKGYPLQYSGLEDSMECIVHGVTKTWTWLSDFHFVSQHSNFRSTLKFIMLCIVFLNLLHFEIYLNNTIALHSFSFAWLESYTL